MEIRELDYSLSDAIVFHDELNPILWDRHKMRPEIRQQLLKIARHFIESMGLDSVRVVDITVSGSNVAYTYTPHSDIDLHIIADIPEMQNDIYRAYFDLKKYEYGNKHSIKIKGIDVELYVQLVGDDVASMGVFSVSENKWETIPKKVKAEIDDATVNAKVDDLSTRAELALKMKDATAIALVKDHIYAMRRAGLEDGGEFSPENLAFKILRTKGVIDALREFGAKAVDTELSLEQQMQVDADKIVREWNGIKEDITAQELSQAETFVNQLWSKLNVNVQLLPKGNLHHFFDRINDRRNGKPITVDELIKLFVAEYKQYGLDISKLDDEVEVVFTDLTTHINVPVVIAPNNKGWGKRMKAKTIMRKKNFGTSNPQLTVEGTIMEVPMSPGALQKFAATPEASKILVGIEYELYVPDAAQGDDSKPNYDNDPEPETIRDIVWFFTDRNADMPLSSREGDALENELREKFDEYVNDNFDNWIENNRDDEMDLIYDKVSDNVSMRDCRLEAEDILGEDADRDAIDELAAKLFDEKVEELLDDSEEYYNAKEEAFEEMMQRYYDQLDDSDEAEWLRYAGYTCMSDVAHAHGVQWPHWSREEGSINKDDVAQSLSDELGIEVVTGEYHANASASLKGKWRIESDSSLDDTGNDRTAGGMEIISPPEPLHQAIQSMKNLIRWAKQTGCFTNETTGLHMNLSVPNFDVAKFDYVKLALFIGDEYVLKSFERDMNTYCKPALMGVKGGMTGEMVKDVLVNMKKELGASVGRRIHNGYTQKFTSINTHMDQGYVEFRSPGGNWLGGELNDLISTMIRFAQGMQIANDPNAHKQEYAKKLFKLMSAANKDAEPDIIGMFSEFVAGDLPKDILVDRLRMRRNVAMVNKINKQYPDGVRQYWRVWVTRSPMLVTEIVARTKEAALKRAQLQNPDWERLRDEMFTVQQVGKLADNPTAKDPKEFVVKGLYYNGIVAAATPEEAIADVVRRTGYDADQLRAYPANGSSNLTVNNEPEMRDLAAAARSAQANREQWSDEEAALDQTVSRMQQANTGVNNYRVTSRVSGNSFTVQATSVAQARSNAVALNGGRQADYDVEEPQQQRIWNVHDPMMGDTRRVTANSAEEAARYISGIRNAATNRFVVTPA